MNLRSPYVFFLVLVVLACQSKPSATDQAATQSKTDSQAVAVSSKSAQKSSQNDFLIVPGERVGPINIKTSEADLLRTLGSTIVTAGDTMYGPEGITYLGTTLYKGTSDEVQISYTDSARIRPEIITIRPNLLDDEGNPIKNLTPTRWTTADGLHIGTTLKELEKRNGKPFKIWGFAWDYGGILSDWQGGKMSGLTTKKSTFALTFGPPIKLTAEQEKAYNNLMGDSEFLSSLPNMQLLNPIVVAIGVGIGQ
ncbi:hypothetical protein GCM10028805_03550 [Spirosoma harenae]